MIGISTKNSHVGSHWLNFLVENSFLVIEINHREKQIDFGAKQIAQLEEARKKNKAIFTIHSGVTDLLHPDKMVAKYQELLLKTEIKYGAKLKVKYIVFHFPPYLNHKKDKRRIHSFLRGILSYARKYKVNLVLENHSKGPWSKPDDILQYFKKYKALKHCLDIGHLNRAVYFGNVKSEEYYLNMLGKYIVYIHLHGNDGKEDRHGALDSGTVKIDYLLPVIKKLKPKVMIIETRRMEDALRTKEILNKYGMY